MDKACRIATRRMFVSVWFALIWLAAMAPATSSARASGPAGMVPGQVGPDFWLKLAPYEDQALRDYRWRSMSAELLTRADEIWRLQATGPQSGVPPPCADAARTLAMMVTSIYHSNVRSQTPADWFHFAPHYAETRGACLRALQVDESSNALPFWFAR